MLSLLVWHQMITLSGFYYNSINEGKIKPNGYPWILVANNPVALKGPSLGILYPVLENKLAKHEADVDKWLLLKGF